MQYRLDHSDLVLVLALVRGKTLARAAGLLQVDVSTVFRSIRRLESALGEALFEKGRAGYLPGTAALALAQQAESAERALEVAQLSLERGQELVSGTVRLTCTDSVLHSLLLPALANFMPNYPALALELSTSNSFANLSRRDADIAVRLTVAPPEHLVGNRLGTVTYRVCAGAEYQARHSATDLADMAWVAPDEFLSDHVTVAWRRQHLPTVVPLYRCNSMLGVAQMVGAGMGVGVLPDFLLRADPRLRPMSEPLAGCDSALWLLTRPDCRSLRSVVTLFSELAAGIRL